MSDEREPPDPTCLQHANTSETPDESGVRPFREFRLSGLLWLLNTAVLHPRGYAVGFHFPDGVDPEVGDPDGWEIMGDGTERWAYAEASPMPDGRTMDKWLDDLFRATKTLMP